MQETAGAAVVRFRTLARLAGAHVLGDVDILSHPEGKAAHQRPRLRPPKVTTQRAIMTLPKHLLPQVSARGDARLYRSPH